MGDARGDIKGDTAGDTNGDTAGDNKKTPRETSRKLPRETEAANYPDVKHCPDITENTCGVMSGREAKLSRSGHFGKAVHQVYTGIPECFVKNNHVTCGGTFDVYLKPCET